MLGPLPGPANGASGEPGAATGAANGSPYDGRGPGGVPGERRLGDLLQGLLAVEMLRVRAAVDQKLTSFIVLALVLLGAATTLVAAAVLLVRGLAAAVAAAFDAPVWVGDLAIGLVVPGLAIGLIVLAHRRRARRRLARAEDLTAGASRSGAPG